MVGHGIALLELVQFRLHLVAQVQQQEKIQKDCQYANDDQRDARVP
jgi:hypothetical protein